MSGQWYSTYDGEVVSAVRLHQLNGQYSGRSTTSSWTIEVGAANGVDFKPGHSWVTYNETNTPVIAGTITDVARIYAGRVPKAGQARWRLTINDPSFVLKAKTIEPATINDGLGWNGTNFVAVTSPYAARTALTRNVKEFARDRAIWLIFQSGRFPSGIISSDISRIATGGTEFTPSVKMSWEGQTGESLNYKMRFDGLTLWDALDSIFTFGGFLWYLEPDPADPHLSRIVSYDPTTRHSPLAITDSPFPDQLNIAALQGDTYFTPADWAGTPFVAAAELEVHADVSKLVNCLRILYVPFRKDSTGKIGRADKSAEFIIREEPVIALMANPLTGDSGERWETLNLGTECPLPDYAESLGKIHMRWKKRINYRGQARLLYDRVHLEIRPGMMVPIHQVEHGNVTSLANVNSVSIGFEDTPDNIPTWITLNFDNSPYTWPMSVGGWVNDPINISPTNPKKTDPGNGSGDPGTGTFPPDDPADDVPPGFPSDGALYLHPLKLIPLDATKGSPVHRGKRTLGLEVPYSDEEWTWDDYRTTYGYANLYAESWSDGAGTPGAKSGQATSNQLVTTGPDWAGTWMGTYWRSDNGTTLPSWLPTDLSGNSDWGVNFGAYFTAPESGTYTFYAYYDDSAEILIDETRVVNGGYPNGLSSGTESSGTITLSAGSTHTITAKFADIQRGNFKMRLSWKAPSGTKALLLSPSGSVASPFKFRRSTTDAQLPGPWDGFTCEYRPSVIASVEGIVTYQGGRPQVYGCSLNLPQGTNITNCRVYLGLNSGFADARRVTRVRVRQIPAPTVFASDTDAEERWWRQITGSDDQIWSTKTDGRTFSLAPGHNRIEFDINPTLTASRYPVASGGNLAVYFVIQPVSVIGPVSEELLSRAWPCVYLGTGSGTEQSYGYLGPNLLPSGDSGWKIQLNPAVPSKTIAGASLDFDPSGSLSGKGHSFVLTQVGGSTSWSDGKVAEFRLPASLKQVSWDFAKLGYPSFESGTLRVWLIYSTGRKVEISKKVVQTLTNGVGTGFNISAALSGGIQTKMMISCSYNIAQ